MKNLVAAVAVAGLAASASATVLYSTSFESPFVNGALPGQQGWATSAAGASTLFQVANTAGLARTGSRFVQFGTANINATVGSTAARWSWIDQVQPSLAGSALPIIRASVWVAVLNSSTTRESTGGIDLYNDAGTARIGAIRIADNGRIDLINGDSINAIVSTPAGAVTPNAYNQVTVEANFNTNTLRYFINGFEIGLPAGFGIFAGSTGFGDADLYVTRNNPTGSSGGDTVLFDDLLIERIPTPGAVSVLALAGLAAARRRRA